MLQRKKIFDILSRKPFQLSVEKIEWVEATINSLSTEKKLAQLINLQIMPGDLNAQKIVEKFQVGAVSVINVKDHEKCKDIVNCVQKSLHVSALVCADIEGGVTSGQMTSIFPNQMGCAAVNSEQAYAEVLKILAVEMKSVGVNWSFSPVADINAKFRSAIVGTRSFGSDASKVSKLVNLHIQVLQANGLASTVKHWPGEGFDDRDQHLLTTINPLSLDEWRKVFQPIYQNAIDAEALSVMSAHIAFPEFAKSKGASGIETYRPASISRFLNQDLLRETLGFNGVIISDATLMGGLECWGPRHEWLPQVLQNGCDMILFTPDVEKDMQTLQQSIADGLLKISRIDEALMRVLGLKAKLNLEQKKSIELPNLTEDQRKKNQIDLDKFSEYSPTLVKDVNQLLPISPERFKRVLLIKEENVNPLGDDPIFKLQIDALLVARGFEVHTFDSTKEDIGNLDQYDLVLYTIAQESLLTKSNIYLDWVKLHGSALTSMTRTWWKKPTILISFGHPYYLYDAPRLPCLINAYAPTPAVQRAVVEKLLGTQAFTGVSPTDPFCGLPDAIF